MLRASIFDTELTPEEVWRSNRVQLAIKLNKLPREIDALPYRDYLDLIAGLEINQIQEQRRSHGMKT